MSVNKGLTRGLVGFMIQTCAAAKCVQTDFEFVYRSNSTMAPRSPMMMVATISLIYISRQYIDAENPVHVWMVRLTYAVAQLLCASVVTYLYFKAKVSVM